MCRCTAQAVETGAALATAAHVFANENVVNFTIQNYP
jgi:hypothetical protein